MTSPNDFTPGRMSKVITENAEMYDDWLEERGIISYRRQLRNRAEAAEAKAAEYEAAILRMYFRIHNSQGDLQTALEWSRI